jgi:hypothetical protein
VIVIEAEGGLPIVEAKVARCSRVASCVDVAVVFSAGVEVIVSVELGRGEAAVAVEVEA